MTKIKKAKIAAVIRKDATLDGQYYDGKGGYCVIGGLLKFAGYPMRKLNDCNEEGVTSLPEDAIELPGSAYGLDTEAAIKLQSCNDAIENRDCDRRQEAVAERRHKLRLGLKDL